MMVKKNYKLKIVMILILFSFIGFAGCKIAENNTGKIWIIDQNDYFHTNDVNRAQKEIPFTIILPKYLPSVLDSEYSFQINGPVNNNSTQEIEIEILYTNDQLTSDVNSGHQTFS